MAACVLVDCADGATGSDSGNFWAWGFGAKGESDGQGFFLAFPVEGSVPSCVSVICSSSPVIDGVRPASAASDPEQRWRMLFDLFGERFRVDDGHGDKPHDADIDGIPQLLVGGAIDHASP